MKPMRYKGYEARIEYSDEDGCFVGHLAGIQDVVGFHGESVEEIRAALNRLLCIRLIRALLERSSRGVKCQPMQRNSIP
jgi:predicted HicB family RNase H-like nuclease